MMNLSPSELSIQPLVNLKLGYIGNSSNYLQVIWMVTGLPKNYFGYLCHKISLQKAFSYLPEFNSVTPEAETWIGRSEWRELLARGGGQSVRMFTRRREGCFLVEDILLTLTRPDTEWNVAIRHGPGSGQMILNILLRLSTRHWSPRGTLFAQSIIHFSKESRMI